MLVNKLAGLYSAQQFVNITSHIACNFVGYNLTLWIDDKAAPFSHTVSFKYTSKSLDRA